MPYRAARPCTYPLCPRLATYDGRCDIHPRPARPWASGRTMPPGWPATRARILARDGYLCRKCRALATEVDHIIRGGGDHDANLQSLCHPCHKAKSQAEINQVRAGNQ